MSFYSPAAGPDLRPTNQKVEEININIEKLNKSTTCIGAAQIILALAMLVMAGVQVWVQLN